MCRTSDQNPPDLEAVHTGNISDDVKEEQSHLLWADCITFISPIWWMSFPAILKGYIDRVMVDGFAYGHGVGKNHTAGFLQNKQGMIISTSGSTIENFNFQESGKMEAILASQDKFTLEFCNIKAVDHLHFGSVGSRLTAEMANSFIATVCEKVSEHFPKS